MRKFLVSQEIISIGNYLKKAGKVEYARKVLNFFAQNVNSVNQCLAQFLIQTLSSREIISSQD